MSAATTLVLISPSPGGRPGADCRAELIAMHLGMRCTSWLDILPVRRRRSGFRESPFGSRLHRRRLDVVVDPNGSKELIRPGFEDGDSRLRWKVERDSRGRPRAPRIADRLL